MSIGERIRDRRLELNMTQEELAIKMGYKSKSTINKIELGINDIPLSKVREFANVLNTTEAYLMEWDDTPVFFKDRLRDLRTSRGLSQVELAQKVGMSKSTIEAYETGDITPSVEALNTLADFFNVNLSYLIGEEDGSAYYLDPEAAELARELYERPEMRVLFDAARDVSKEDIEVVVRMLEGLKK